MSSPSLSLSLSLFFSCLPFLSLLPFLCPFSCAPSRGGRPGQDLIRRFITYERWQGHAAMLGQPRLLTAGNYTLLGTRLGPEPTDTRHPPNSSPSSFFRKPSPLPSPTLERFPLDAHALYFRSFRLHAPSDATVFFFFFFFEVYMRYSLRIFIISNSKLKRERERERETRLPAASTIEATNRSVHLRIAIIQALRPWRARPWEESGLFLFFFFFFFGRRDLSRSRGDLRGGWLKKISVEWTGCDEVSLGGIGSCSGITRRFPCDWRALTPGGAFATM